MFWFGFSVIPKYGEKKNWNELTLQQQSKCVERKTTCYKLLLFRSPNLFEIEKLPTSLEIIKLIAVTAKYGLCSVIGIGCVCLRMGLGLCLWWC